jgi:hypothetical protein
MSDEIMPTRIIVNCETGEQTVVQIPSEEIIAMQADVKARLDAENAKQQALDSAHAKLSALGLTPEEISAITGINQ